MASSQTETKRNANMDILRMISMMMVTMLHALTKSDLLPFMGGNVGANGWIAWALEILSVPAVNIFMFISGYFMISSKFKIRRLAELVFQALFYSAGVYGLFVLLGQAPDRNDRYGLLPYFLPIHMETYWFLSAYVIIYLLLPLLISGVHAMTKKQLQGVIFWLLLFECVIKSFLPVRLSMDSKGYSFLWYLTLFLAGAYVRLYGFRFLHTARRGRLLYFGSSLLILAEIRIVSQIQARTGHLKEMTTVALEYNHILVFCSAIGIFAAFLHAKQPGEKIARLAGRLSPYCLGVYLLQESPLIRYLWQDWFGLREMTEQSVPVFLGRILGAVAAMFALGICADILRSVLFRIVTAFIRKDKDPCST